MVAWSLAHIFPCGLSVCLHFVHQHMPFSSLFRRPSTTLTLHDIALVRFGKKWHKKQTWHVFIWYDHMFTCLYDHIFIFAREFFMLPLPKTNMEPEKGKGKTSTNHQVYPICLGSKCYVYTLVPSPQKLTHLHHLPLAESIQGLLSRSHFIDCLIGCEKSRHVICHLAAPKMNSANKLGVLWFFSVTIRSCDNFGWW